MSNLPAIAEPQEVAGKALTVEESVDFKLQAWQSLAVELKAFISKGVPTIAGPSDKVGYAKVSEWRKKAMRARTGLDADRKALTEESRKYQALVNSKAKEITAEIETVENALFAEENRIDKLIEAEKAEKQRIINERVSKRTQDLLAVRHDVAGIAHLLAGMPEDQYQTIYVGAKTKFDAEEAERVRKETELARLQAEAAARKAEEERKRREELDAQEARNRAERTELDRIAREQREAQAKIEAQQAAIKAEQERIEREAREAKEAQERKEREAAEAEARAKAEKAAALAKLAAIEAAKPDTEKLKAFLSSFDAVTRPELKTEAAEKVLGAFEADLADLIVRATINAEGLIK